VLAAEEIPEHADGRRRDGDGAGDRGSDQRNSDVRRSAYASTARYWRAKTPRNRAALFEPTNPFMSGRRPNLSSV
jgi:hypothetical protein